MHSRDYWSLSHSCFVRCSRIPERVHRTIPFHFLTPFLTTIHQLINRSIDQSGSSTRACSIAPIYCIDSPAQHAIVPLPVPLPFPSSSPTPKFIDQVDHLQHGITGGRLFFCRCNLHHHRRRRLGSVGYAPRARRRVAGILSPLSSGDPSLVLEPRPTGWRNKLLLEHASAPSSENKSDHRVANLGGACHEQHHQQ